MSPIGARTVGLVLLASAWGSGGALAGPRADTGTKGPETAGQLPAVRPVDAAAEKLLAEARRLSPTVEREIAALETSDVVVYLTVRLMSRCRTGRLTFLSAVAEVRYLKIEIAPTSRKDEAIGWLGHELQHALEVASAREARDEAGLERLYRRIGHPQEHQASRFETDDAIRMGDKVLAEVHVSASRAIASRSWR